MTTKKKSKTSPNSIVREIKRRTRRKFTAEEKIRIVLEGLRGEESISDLCRKEGIHPTMYYKWSKSFLESGKRQLNGDTIREASSNEVKELRDENDELKMLVAEVVLRNRVLKKILKGSEYASIDT
jgi:transposase